MNYSSKHIEESARSKKLTRTGLSQGEQQFIEKFNPIKIHIDSKNTDGSLRVDFPNEKVDYFIKIWSENIKPGYWCEYVGPRTGFIFKLPSNEFKHIELKNNASQSEINKIMQLYIPKWRIDQDLWQWIYSCDIFTDWI